MSSNDKTYEIKSGGRPSGNPARYTFEEVQSLLEATDPGKVSAAGTAFHNAAQAAAHVAHALYLAGSHLSEKWEGADADAAQKALAQLYATANELYGRSNQAGQALQFYGGTLSQYKGLKFPGGGASSAEDPARQKAAETVMRAVNQHMGTAWDAMPDKVQQNLPTVARDVGEENTNLPQTPQAVGWAPHLRRPPAHSRQAAGTRSSPLVDPVVLVGRLRLGLVPSHRGDSAPEEFLRGSFRLRDSPGRPRRLAPSPPKNSKPPRPHAAE